MEAFCPKCKEQRMSGSGSIKVNGVEPKMPSPNFKCGKCGTRLMVGNLAKITKSNDMKVNKVDIPIEVKTIQ